MIAKKPPMGWNSWNTFGDKINEQLIKEMADRIVEDAIVILATNILLLMTAGLFVSVLTESSLLTRHCFQMV